MGTTALTSLLPVIVVVAALLTAIASVLLLRLYRRATVRAMGRVAGVAPTPPASTDEGAATRVDGPPLVIEHRDAGAAPGTPLSASDPSRRAARAVRAAALVYAAGGIVYALILTIPWMIGAGGGLVLGRLLWLSACYTWPAVLAVGLVATTSTGERLRLTGAYFGGTLVVAIYVLVRSPDLTVGQLIFFWLWANAPATLLLIAFLHRRVRAVGPLVLAFMVTSVTGAALVFEVAGSSDTFVRAFVELGVALGLGAKTLLVLMHAIGLVPLGLVGWWLLIRIGRRYRAKRFSDLSITLDALWLLFAIVQSITLTFEHWGWIFTGLVAFAGGKLTTVAGFAWLRRHAAARAGEPPMLLLLRVFALGRRSERLFDTLSSWWRRLGSVSMIAGPDLATSALEPHEFIDFLSGRLSRQFVKDESDLERRLGELDEKPDPDGRYRVNEFFCHADTWRMTMRRLAKRSTAVLMDLRSFSRANAGCLYELEQLLEIVQLERVAFLVDETTDAAFLEEALRGLWSRLGSDSPNLATASPTVTLFHARDQSARALRALLVMLVDVDGPAVERAPPQVE